MPCLVRLAAASALALALGLAAVAAEAKSAHAADWIYFDVGETLVTASGDDAYKLVPDAAAKLQALSKLGYHLGVISNIPAAWGATCPEKLKTLKEHLAKGLTSGAAGAAFPWATLQTAILPPEDRYQKPKSYLFSLARSHACPGHALFVGEDGAEVDAARAAGLAAIKITTGELPTPEQIKAALAALTATCGQAPSPVASLLPGDVGLNGKCLETP